jgi:hypothetical protein
MVSPPPISPILQTENRIVTFAAQKDGSLRVTCLSWPDAVIHPVGEATALHVTEIDTPPCLPLPRVWGSVMTVPTLSGRLVP